MVIVVDAPALGSRLITTASSAMTTLTKPELIIFLLCQAIFPQTAALLVVATPFAQINPTVVTNRHSRFVRCIG